MVIGLCTMKAKKRSLERVGLGEEVAVSHARQRVM